MDAEGVRHPEHDGQQAWHHHPQRKVEPQVHPLRNNPAEEHEEGVGEEVAGVEEAQVGLGLVLRFPVQLSYPRSENAK